MYCSDSQVEHWPSSCIRTGHFIIVKYLSAADCVWEREKPIPNSLFSRHYFCSSTTKGMMLSLLGETCTFWMVIITLLHIFCGSFLLTYLPVVWAMAYALGTYHPRCLFFYKAFPQMGWIHSFACFIGTCVCLRTCNPFVSTGKIFSCFLLFVMHIS